MGTLTTDVRARLGGGLRPDKAERGVQIGDAVFVREDLGAPAAAAANNICTSQAVTVGTTPLASLNGSLASDGVATLDVPRNVVAAWTGTAVVTITGTDEYGQTVVESSASGTSLTGKKAFKTVTSVSFSANVTGATVGTGGVLGLSYRVANGGFVSGILGPNTTDAGTVAMPDTNTATATTGDVRGTYAPAGTLNGSNRFFARYFVAPGPDTTDTYGVAQYRG